MLSRVPYGAVPINFILLHMIIHEEFKVEERVFRSISNQFNEELEPDIASAMVWSDGTDRSRIKSLVNVLMGSSSWQQVSDIRILVTTTRMRIMILVSSKNSSMNPSFFE